MERKDSNSEFLNNVEYKDLLKEEIQNFLEEESEKNIGYIDKKSKFSNHDHPE